MTPREWLAQEPLQDGEQLFVILASTSECQPVAAWRQADGGPLSPVWAGSEYAAWAEVMPYVALVSESSGFLDWVAECAATDWGWLAVSSSPLPTVVEHLASLTKVRLPEGQEVFFRFWDGGYLLPILQGLGPGAGGGACGISTLLDQRPAPGSAGHGSGGGEEKSLVGGAPPRYSSSLANSPA